jgi:hypothetical protein
MYAIGLYKNSYKYLGIEYIKTRPYKILVFSYRYKRRYKRDILYNTKGHKIYKK